MNNYITAIRKATNYSEKIIRQTLDMETILPLPLPGTIQWNIWITYNAIREYERITRELRTEA